MGKEAKGAARFLLAALPALGAVLTALAITGDLVGRMARNHTLASFGAFGFAAVAVFLGALAAFGLPEGSNAERRVVYGGLAALGVSLLFTVYAGVSTWGDRPQPSITVRPKQGASVAISVRGVGLRSNDHIIVEVEQLVRVADEAGLRTWTPGKPLYGASLGPDSSGDVDQTVEPEAPAGRLRRPRRTRLDRRRAQAVLRERQHDRLRPRARFPAAGAPTALGALGNVRQSAATAGQAEGTEPPTAPSAVDDAARLRSGARTARTEPRRVVTRT